MHRPIQPTPRRIALTSHAKGGGEADRVCGPCWELGSEGYQLCFRNNAGDADIEDEEKYQEGILILSPILAVNS